jgi:hypothetical protein
MASPSVEPISGYGRALRAVVAVVIVVLAVYGSVRGHDKMFPFGPESQYDQYVSPNGTVGSITVWADTNQGTHVPVQLDAAGVGLKRADIEAQLPRILADPSLLRTISNAQHRLHPSQAQFVRLYIIDTTTQLHDRVPVGNSRRTLLTWTVPQ